MNCLPLIPIHRNPAADQPVLVTRLIVLGALYTSLGLVLPFRYFHGLFPLLLGFLFAWNFSHVIKVFTISNYFFFGNVVMQNGSKLN